MEIKLDDKYTITTDQWGYPILICHKSGEPARKKTQKGNPINGRVFYFQTYGQAVRAYVMQQTGNEDIHTLKELAKKVDLELENVAKRIDQQMEGYER